MIPYDLDPSLHANEPEKASLDDGFSPPLAEAPGTEEFPADADAVLPVLSGKSPF